MKLFPSGGSPYQTGLAMAGAKAGDAVLVLGAADPDFCAEIARVTGLNGRTLVIDPSAEAPARLDAAGGRAGALVESHVGPLDRLPPGLAAFDLVLIMGPLAEWPAPERLRIVQNAVAALRPGGRLILVDGMKRSGLLGRFRGGSAHLSESDIRPLMEAAGIKAVRALANVDGIAYWEGRH